MAKKPDTSRQYAMLLGNLTGRTEASAWTLSRSYGLPIERVREQMKINNVEDTDKE